MPYWSKTCRLSESAFDFNALKGRKSELSESAFELNAKIGQKFAVFWKRILLKYYIGPQLGFAESAFDFNAWMRQNLSMDKILQENEIWNIKF